MIILIGSGREVRLGVGLTPREESADAGLQLGTDIHVGPLGTRG